MDVSQVLIDKIIEFEGMKLETYVCPGGMLMIGVGHTYGVKLGMRITKEQAISLLRGDLMQHRRYIDNMHLELTQGQYDALVDFSFDCGIANLVKSTLLRKVISRRPKKEVAEEFRTWKSSGGQKRREWEAKRYEED